MRLLFLLFLLLTFTFSCKKETIPNINCSTKTNDIETVKLLLNGSYNWVYTTVRIRGIPTFTETPTTTGLNYKYVFNKNATVDYYENNILKSSDITSLTMNLKYQLTLWTQRQLL